MVEASDSGIITPGGIVLAFVAVLAILGGAGGGVVLAFPTLGLPVQ